MRELRHLLDDLEDDEDEEELEMADLDSDNDSFLLTNQDSQDDAFPEFGAHEEFEVDGPLVANVRAVENPEQTFM